MIQAIILDIDGVIVGEKIGFNSPNPHPDVIALLKETRGKGTPIILSTAKPHFAIDLIIESAGLSNPHITDGGGVLINPMTKEIVKKHTIPADTVLAILGAMLENNIYVEFYTVDEYFLQRSQVSETTKKHTHILQREPHVTKNLLEEAKRKEITKIMPVAEDEKQKQEVTKVFESLRSNAVLSWGLHPVALPRQFGIITAPGISKREGAIEILNSLNISFENTLGVGDSASDWQFIELCKYGAAMENASDELKQLVQSKGKECSYIGPSVDENGIIDVLNYFLG